MGRFTDARVWELSQYDSTAGELVVAVAGNVEVIEAHAGESNLQNELQSLQCHDHGHQL